MATMRERQREVQLYRGQVPSPGRPTVAWREDRVRFWGAVACGLKTEEAARAAGVSAPGAFRWFRQAGGVNPCLSPTVSGRYLSFFERHEHLRQPSASLRAARYPPNPIEIDPATISASPAVTTMAVVALDVPERPAANANGTVKPSDIPMITSRIVSLAVKCFSI